MKKPPFITSLRLPLYSKIVASFIIIIIIMVAGALTVVLRLNTLIDQKNTQAPLLDEILDAAAASGDAALEYIQSPTERDAALGQSRTRVRLLLDSLMRVIPLREAGASLQRLDSVYGTVSEMSRASLESAISPEGRSRAVETLRTGWADVEASAGFTPAVVRAALGEERRLTFAALEEPGKKAMKLGQPLRVLISSADSLYGLVAPEDSGAGRSVQALRETARRLDSLSWASAESLRIDPAYSTTGIRRQLRNLADSLRQMALTLRTQRLSLEVRELPGFKQNLRDSREIALLVLGLTLLLSMVFGILVARTWTRPIRALQAGTQKVAEGKYETVPVTSTDELADLTQAFNTMSDKLRQLDEMRMQMMSEISHEMRTPLQVIKAGCYTIIHAKDGPILTERQKDAVGKIHQATNRINQFINLFLDVAKMEAGLMTFDFQQADLTEMVTPLIQEMQLIGLTRRIAVELKTEPLPPLALDKDRMAQVFGNLLSNALKYTPDGGSITVRMRTVPEFRGIGAGGKGCVRVDVQDTGVGIPEGDLANLFKKFYQAHNTPLVNEKGSGLGLALVKHIAEAHGGMVDVQSTVGVGSTFSLYLPIR